MSDYQIPKSEKLPKVNGRSFSGKISYIKHLKRAKETGRKVTFK